MTVRERRVPDADSARRRILDAAQEQFARAGFDATPTARIAEQADVPKGLVFYYFPTKIEMLRALLAERLPATPSSAPEGIVRRGDVEGSLLRLSRRLNLDRHRSPVLSTIIFREAETHPEVGEYVQNLRSALTRLTESVLEAAATVYVDPTLRRQAAQTYVAVLLDHANARRFAAPMPDLRGAARIVAGGLAVSRPVGSASSVGAAG